MRDEGYLYFYNKSRMELVNSAEQAEIRRLEYLNPMAMIKYTSADWNENGSDDADSWGRQPRQRRELRKRKRSD
ncbi:hypothetical protein MMC29_001890 [Sticta canariensis]|nr:hypothetical protein [Sticta canariensis]